MDCIITKRTQRGSGENGGADVLSFTKTLPSCAACVSEVVPSIAQDPKNRRRKEHHRLCWPREHASTPGSISADKQGEIRFGLQ